MITVEVPNSPPIRTDEPHPDKITLESAKDNYLLEIEAHFTDADVGDPEFYRIASKPDWFLIETKEGFVVDGDTETGGFQLAYEVLQKVESGSDFSVSIYANDGSGDESSRPVVLTFEVGEENVPPRPVPYPVTQKATGELKTEAGPLKVGPRLGVEHTVTFQNSNRGFVFSNSEAIKLSDAGLLPDGHDANNVDVDAFYEAVDKTFKPSSLPVIEVVGSDYYLLRSTGAVVAEWANTLAENPEVTFKLEKGSSGSIIVEYHVWAYSRRPIPDREPPDVPTTTKKIVRKSLTINVVTCSSPPDPIDDCP